MTQQTEQVVFTNKARCRDCYRCLRGCPVKAIKLEDAQAQVVSKLCLNCGTCIRECPQGAKSFRSDLSVAKAQIRSGEVIVASVAPSYAGIYEQWQSKRIPSVLRSLGFNRVEETAVGAYYVGNEVSKQIELAVERPIICTACPSVVSYIQKYRQSLVQYLAPISSPMHIHGKMIKKRNPNAKVVFIGPCVAKKMEADSLEDRSIDCVITFKMLDEWMKEESLSFNECEPSEFDISPPGHARLFPIPGGVARTGSFDSDLISESSLSVSGFYEVKEMLDSIEHTPVPVFVEALFCSQGCINGPTVSCEKPLFTRKIDLMSHAGQHSLTTPSEILSSEMLTEGFEPMVIVEDSFTEEDIQRLFEDTAKGDPEKRLDCGACGYDTCRDKAIATLRGMAEKEMCIPLMRRLAEKRTDRIMETSPNGLVILNDKLAILHMNPAFKKYFMCSDAILGQHISYLMDPHPFEQLALGETDIVDAIVDYTNYNLIFHQIAYPLRAEKQFVGVFADITNSRINEQKLEQMREETVRQAQELLEHQMNMAQEVTKFLGQSTAKGELLVKKLMTLASDKPNKKEHLNPWDIFTRK